jgi:transcriptional regulator with XRE-family HTH domain
MDIRAKICSHVKRSRLFFPVRVLDNRSVPRKNSLPPLEIAICERVRWFRHESGHSRRSFAKKAGIDESYLVRVEHKRTPLRFSAFKALHRTFDLDPFWLRTGIGNTKTGFVFDDSEYSASVKTRDLFSAVYDRFLAGEARLISHAANESIRSVIADMNILANEAEAGRLPNVPPAAAQDALRSAENLINALGSMRACAHISLPSSEKSLTDVSLKSKTASMKSEMQKLIEKVKAKASRPGGKSQLATELGVAPARVSEWLSGKKEPGGEYTLRLLKWVES